MPEVIEQSQMPDVRCPECGAKVARYEAERPIRQQMIRDELWPGVVVESSPKQIFMEPAGPFVTTLHPCGHQFVGEDGANPVFPER